MPSHLLYYVFLSSFFLSSSCKEHKRELPSFSTIQPSNPQISAAAATLKTLSPVSNVQGKAYNRFIQIWLENTNFDKAFGDPNMEWLATHGISLTNYWALTHRSQPNYLAAAAGDHFGLTSDNFITVPANISTVADLLDTKGISYGEYQESMPYAGYQGYAYDNEITGANDYVRKHNPLVLFDSVVHNKTRLSLLKNFTSFAADLAAEALPQWAFITPNMTNNGHDTSITTAGRWARSFLEPLLRNSYFMKNTLLLLTFDENEHYATPNKVYSILLGGAIPSSLKGSTDDTFYTHYSTLSTLSQNFDLPSLGRWDCGANVFALVANKTGYANYAVDANSLYLNSSYPGALSSSDWRPWSAPNTKAKCVAGNGVLAEVVWEWGRVDGALNYTSPYPYDEESETNGGVSVSRLPAPSPTATETGTAIAAQSGTGTAEAVAATTSSAGVAMGIRGGGLSLLMWICDLGMMVLLGI